MSIIIKKIKKNLNKKEISTLSHLATLNSNSIRRDSYNCYEYEYRYPFSIDADRIMYSSAYTRYIDKTQVFSLSTNDHITHRALHVQLVSKIARTIGKFLSFNEDLIEAISLGHDIGHPPFGHDGEFFLSKLCNKNGIGNFFHNIQSVQFLDKIERKGKGWNLSLQTLDGILCHDGETHYQKLIPNRKKNFQTLKLEITNKKYNNFNLTPMTYEGCVVKIADVISYVGKDLEDAIRLKLIKRSEVPSTISNILGNTNGSIVFNLVTDLIENSYNNISIGFSLPVSNALKELKKFNLKYIYTNPKIKKHLKQTEKLFKILFEEYMESLQIKNKKSDIFSSFLDGMSEKYISNHNNAEMVRDYIAGMTDGYFLKHFKKFLRPKPLIHL